MKMIHAGIDAIGECINEEVFNAIWAPREWELLDEPRVVASDVLGKPVKDLDDLIVEELKYLVAARGLAPFNKSAGKPAYLKAYTDSFTDEGMAEYASALQAAEIAALVPGDPVPGQPSGTEPEPPEPPVADPVDDPDHQDEE